LLGAGRIVVTCCIRSAASRYGWGQPLECIADTALFGSVGKTRNGHNGCSFVVATRSGWLARSELPALGNDPAVRALLPPLALVAGLRVSDRRDVLDIRYGVAPPASFGVSGWFAGPDGLTGPQHALVAGLGEWAQQARITAVAALALTLPLRNGIIPGGSSGKGTTTPCGTTPTGWPSAPPPMRRPRRLTTSSSAT
jgi:hypothetical protein